MLISIFFIYLLWVWKLHLFIGRWAAVISVLGLRFSCLIFDMLFILCFVSLLYMNNLGWRDFGVTISSLKFRKGTIWKEMRWKLIVTSKLKLRNSPHFPYAPSFYLLEFKLGGKVNIILSSPLPSPPCTSFPQTQEHTKRHLCCGTHLQNFLLHMEETNATEWERQIIFRKDFNWFWSKQIIN